MSVAFESNSISSNSNRIQTLGFANGMWIYNLSDSSRLTGGNPWSSKLPAVKEEEDSTSSSIGNNSGALNAGGDSDEDDGGEVQSASNDPLNALNALEEVLPIRRGISTFYAGKSKSYGSLADASSVPSIQDIVKPDDAYTRKRKNMLAHNLLVGKNHKSNSESGISKRLAITSRSTLARGLTSNSHDTDESGRRLPTNESPGSSARFYCSPWRSLSLSDLQHAAAFAATSSVNGSVINERNKEV